MQVLGQEDFLAVDSLIVLDSPPDQNFLNYGLLGDMLKNRHNVHVVIIPKNHKSFRNSTHLKIINARPLSIIHSTKRIVYSLLKNHHFKPEDADRDMIKELAILTKGYPHVVSVICSLLQSYEQNTFQSFLKPLQTPGIQSEIDPISCSSDVQDVGDTNITKYSIEDLFGEIQLSPEECRILYCLSFIDGPFPDILVTEIATILTHACKSLDRSTSILEKFKINELVVSYPEPIITHPKLTQVCDSLDWVYIPPFVIKHVRKLGGNNIAFAVLYARDAIGRLESRVNKWIYSALHSLLPTNAQVYKYWNSNFPPNF